MSAMTKVFFLVLAMYSTTVLAEDDDSYTSYDSIVSQLETAVEKVEPPSQVDDWDEVALHGGVGLTASYVNITSGGGAEGSGILKGFVAHFGVNMFSRQARIEGLFRNYAREDLSSDVIADVKEFEFRGIFLPPMRDSMKLRFGAGLSARYMNMSSKQDGRWSNHKVSTPTGSILVGLEKKITPTVSIGPDLSYRSALISETFDKSSWDAALRLNATF